MTQKQPMEWAQQVTHERADGQQARQKHVRHAARATELWQQNYATELSRQNSSNRSNQTKADLKERQGVSGVRRAGLKAKGV